VNYFTDLALKIIMQKKRKLIHSMNITFIIRFLQSYRVEGKFRSNIKPGFLVKVIQKSDQKTGNLTEGIVREILTNSASHPFGIKVLLENGVIGRVKEIVYDTKNEKV
jgi:uncharacterized repeat protein (TIGR03833 family)